MVKIELNTEQAQELREILENYVSDLRMEIVDTEGHEYREMLKKRRDFISSLLEQIVEQLKGS